MKRLWLGEKTAYAFSGETYFPHGGQETILNAKPQIPSAPAPPQRQNAKVHLWLCMFVEWLSSSKAAVGGTT